MEEDYQAEMRRRIRAALDAKGWTDKQLSLALGHPHTQTVKRWLADDHTNRAISIRNLAKLAKVLNLPVKTLDPTGEAYDPSNRPPHMRRGHAGGAFVRSQTSKRLPQQQPEPGRDAVYYNDPLLTAVVQAWPWLAEDVRREIAQQVIASTPTTPTTPTDTPRSTAQIPKAGG